VIGTVSVKTLRGHKLKVVLFGGNRHFNCQRVVNPYFAENKSLLQLSTQFIRQVKLTESGANDSSLSLNKFLVNQVKSQ